MCDRSPPPPPPTPPDNRERVRGKNGGRDQTRWRSRFVSLLPLLPNFVAALQLLRGVWVGGSSRASEAGRQQPWQQQPQYGNCNNLSERQRSLIKRQLCPRSIKKEKKGKNEEEEKEKEKNRHGSVFSVLR